MKAIISIVSFLILVVGCKQSFSIHSETALALPILTEEKPSVTANSVVFIAGFDEGTNTYYENAKKYFGAKHNRVIDNLFSMEEIITWLNQNSNSDTCYDEIHIVSHSNPWLGMSLKTVKEGERISVKTLQEAQLKNEIGTLKIGVNSTTKIIFHSCGLGENEDLLKELKRTFTTEQEPKVYASSFFNVFGGKYAPHYLAKSYYNFYPTAESPGPLQLAEEFKTTYPKMAVDWFTALKTRQETTANTPYSYKFNIPVNWEFSFDTAADVPKLSTKDAIMDWISESPEMAAVLLELNIPLEKYRWKSEIRGNKLFIKGKTTVLCVLVPGHDTKNKNEYSIPMIGDSTLYQIL